MVNGRITHAMFIDDQEISSPATDMMPKSVQFNKSCENYRCLCNCFHIKTGAFIVAGTELLMLLIFLINSLVIIAQDDTEYEKITGTCDSYVMQSFSVSMIGIGLSFLAVLLLFIGLIRNTAALLIPHLITQMIVVLILVFGLSCGIIAFSTNTTLFYRLMNAASFKEHPRTTTVALDTETTARFITIFILNLICLMLQCWYIMIIHNCYCYLKERCRYMHYCLAFSTPMQTLIFR
uniref:Lysosomal-associated transmembrane protein 4A n=1 Tax=Elaeophora elaphi TaxID=1147741 RepID=A0A0R3S1R4_9BILA